MNYLDKLNDQQREAVTTISGPLLVIAGAGSGKTRVLTTRICHLIQNGIQPWQILALTFTNKAAAEMKARIAQMLSPQQANALWMGTFHSIFLRILRHEAQPLGFTNTFSVYDTSASRTLISRIIKEMDLPAEDYKPAVIASRISMAKNSLVTPDQYASTSSILMQDRAAKRPATAEIYQTYTEYLARANAMDFDDLLVKMCYLLTNNQAVREKYQQKFTHLLVDEYQDTNAVQNRILNLLAAQHRNLCVVGDDAQSIYAFRGAKIQNILQFPKVYPELKLIKLITNYRSTEPIVAAANRLIDHNAHRIKKECIAHTKTGENVTIHNYYVDTNEAYEIAKEINDLVFIKGVQPDQIAILYRTNAQSRLFEQALKKYGVAYRVYGGVSFYQREEIQDLIAYFRLITNPADEEALRRIINKPTRGIGPTTVDRLTQAANAHGATLWQTIQEIETVNADLRPNAVNAIVRFRDVILEAIAAVQTDDAFTIATKIYESSGMQAALEADSSVEAQSRRENLSQLFSDIEEYTNEQIETGAAEMVSLPMFLDNVSLTTDADNADKVKGPMVTLTTIHSAKGLEFDYVYVVGMEETIFPSSRSLYEESGLEEERRLCYVAVTRAAKKLTLSHAFSRTYFGRPQNNAPSRFLSEIEPDYLAKLAQQRRPGAYEPSAASYGSRGYERPAPRTPSVASYARPQRPQAPAADRYSIAPDEVAAPSQLAVGDNVLHARFGRGVIRNLQGEGTEMRAIVHFGALGEKTLLLKFAQLKKL